MIKQWTVINTELILWLTDTIVWPKECENADLCGGIFFVWSCARIRYTRVDVLQIVTAAKRSRS